MQGGRAAKAAIYPIGVCLAILRGLRKQLQTDGELGINGVGTVCEEKSYENEYIDKARFIDDVTGKPLDPGLVRAARAEEIQGVSKYGVWIKVPLKECYDNTGKAPVGGRWVDHNKGDDINPDVRCR